MKMLKLKLVNPNNPQADTTMAVDPKEIKQVLEATDLDRRQRPEMSAVIFTPFGSFAVREKFDFILAKVEEAHL